MPTHREQIIAIVDEGVRNGTIPETMRSKYIEDMAADPRRAEFWAGNLMRSADYTNKRKEEAARIAQEEQRVAADRARVQAERSELQNWQRNAEAEIERLRRFEGESARYQAAVAQYKQIIRDFKLEEQDPLKDWQPGQPAAAPSHQPPPGNGYQPPAQPTQPAPYVTTQDAVETIGRVVDMQGELAVIAANHQYLFGQPLLDNIVAEARAANQLHNIRGYWESKYNVGAKRAEVESAAREKEIARIRAEEREKVMAELAADPSRIVSGGSVWQPEQSPLALNYMASRALAHNPVAQHNRGPEAPPVGQTDPALPRVPEQINHLDSRRTSIESAKNFFNSRFNPDGTPINRGGGPAQ